MGSGYQESVGSCSVRSMGEERISKPLPGKPQKFLPGGTSKDKGLEEKNKQMRTTDPTIGSSQVKREDYHHGRTNGLVMLSEVLPPFLG